MRSFEDGADRWTIAEESEGSLVQMEPFFVTQRLPGEKSSVFALTIPFTPGGQRIART